MLPELGGVTIVALFLSRKGVRGGVLLVWLLFAAVAWIHSNGVVLP